MQLFFLVKSVAKNSSFQFLVSVVFFFLNLLIPDLKDHKLDGCLTKNIYLQ